MENKAWTDHPEDCIRQRIEAFVAESPENRMAQLDGAPFFDAPLVGFADGDDPLFSQFKTIIGPSHLTPREWIAEAGACPDAPHTSLERLSVIGYILPITEETRVSNRAETRQPSLRWAHQRTHGEEFNKLVRGSIVDLLREAG